MPDPQSLPQLTPSQTRDLILGNILQVVDPQVQIVFAFILGIQLCRADPILAAAIERVTVAADGEDERVAGMADVDRAVAAIRDRTVL